MVKGTSGMGFSKHHKSGTPGKSPRFRHLAKLEAEKNERKDRSRIKDAKSTVKELFKGKGKIT